MTVAVQDDRRGALLEIEREPASGPLSFHIVLEEHAGVAEAIAWFLPPHYSVVLVSETGLPDFISI